jgi:hypothetical protein
LLSLVGPLALGVPALVWLDRVPLWDGLLVLLSFGAGLALGRRAAPAAAGVALFVLVADITGRAALPPPPRFLDPDSPWPILRRHDEESFGDEVCGLLGGAPGDRAALPDPAGRGLVLHLGDSMLVFGSDGPDGAQPDDDRFPQRLGHADPGRLHVNLGVPGTSADAHLAIARGWLSRGDVRAVVSYAFLNNDLTELGRPLPCCDGPPVDLTAPGAPSVCAAPPSPAWPALADLARRSVDPVAVRAAAASPTWGHLRAALSTAWGPNSPLTALRDADDSRLGGDQLTDAISTLVRLLTATRDAAAAHGAAHLVVLLPAAGDGPLRPPDRPDARPLADQLAAACRDAGLDCLNAWELLDGPAGCPPTWFLRDTYHLSADGHAALAAWLEPRLLRPPLAERPPEAERPPPERERP